jgi:pimeloyl-ACP methyl ester carboxylesterase
MSKPDKAALRSPIRLQDLQGLARLGFDATIAVTNLVENMHQTIASRAGILGPGQDLPTRGITGLVYRLVRGTTRVAGLGVDHLTGLLNQGQDSSSQSSPEREAVIAAMCGVWGDHMRETRNPLAIQMAFRVQGQALTLTRVALQQRLAQPKARLLVLVHGLCMNDLQWQRRGHDHGSELANALGMTALYLNYNTGLHVSQNGEMFSKAMQTLIEQWPVPVEELVVIGHSMGGLVARSACHHAQAAGLNWLSTLRQLVCLGTPHHGAPLERGGQLIDSLLGQSPYLAPFARLGKARSAGIADLRFGNVQQADWSAHRKHDQKVDERLPTPLPPGVQTYLVAAVQAQRTDHARNAWIGDGLVPLASALGEHARSELALSVPDSHKQVVTGANHWDLLNSPEVYQQLLVWLSPPSAPS